jgi:hypothetical protein
MRVRSAGTKDAEKIIAEGETKFFLRNKDYPNYAKSAISYFNTYTDLNAYQLNSIAWTMYEHIDDKTSLTKAAEMAKKASTQEDIYAYNDTYAAVLYKLGEKQKAKETAEHAIELAKKEGEDYKETSELLKKISKLK